MYISLPLVFQGPSTEALRDRQRKEAAQLEVV